MLFQKDLTEKPVFYKNTDYLLPDKGVVNSTMLFVGFNDILPQVQ